MKITVYGKQMAVRESLKEAIAKKLSKFDRFFGEDAEAQVTCRVRKGDKILEITIPYEGTTYRAEQEGETFLTALDRAVDALDGQIRKNKTRLEKRVRSGAFVTASFEDDDEYVEEGKFELRVKKIPLRPMFTEDAILQMNLLDHSFFVFTDAETGKTEVVYKRKDGGYGILVPEG